MEFTSYEESMIRNMMLSKSFKEIATILDSTADQVGKYVTDITVGTNVVTFQHKLDDKKVNNNRVQSLKIKSTDTSNVDKQRDRDREDRMRRLYEINRKQEVNQREQRLKMKTLVVDYSKLVSVRIDNKTIIYAKPGHEEEAKQKFLKNYTKPIDKY